VSDFLLDQYEEYLERFEDYGRKVFSKPLTFEQFETLSVEAEDIAISDECGVITKKQCKRREEIERLTLVHESYFADDKLSQFIFLGRSQQSTVAPLPSAPGRRERRRRRRKA
jgi:hypothetical protein